MRRLTPFTLRKAGPALYGERWQSELARALGVTDRTIRRWLGGGAIPDDAGERVVEICQTRMETIEGVMRRLQGSKPNVLPARIGHANDG